MPYSIPLVILFVEDSEEDFELIKRALVKGEINFTGNRVSTLEEFKGQVRFNPPDIIISDYNLSGFTGFDALDHLKEYQLDVPLIIVSGFIGEEKAVQFLKRGALDYISKENIDKISVAVKRTISEVKLKREKALAQQKLELEIERNRKLVTAMSEGLVLLDDRTHIIFTNKAFQKMIGYTEEELLNRKWVELLRNAPDFVPLISKTEGRREAQLMGKHGDSIWVDISLSEIRNNEERQIIQVISDKSAERENEAQLKELNSEMEQLIYRASHDLRGPISSLEGLLETLKLQHIDPEISRACDEMISESYQILESLALVTKFQQRPLSVETLFLKPVLVELCEEIFKTTDNKITFNLNISDVYTDKDALHTIFYNLLDNILKHAVSKDKPLEIKFDSNRINNQVLITVSDNGQGIPMEHRKNIFKMFYRANPEIRSTGLGLYLSKKISKRLGGDLYLSQSEENGCKFILSLPDPISETYNEHRATNFD